MRGGNGFQLDLTHPTSPPDGSSNGTREFFDRETRGWRGACRGHDCTLAERHGFAGARSVGGLGGPVEAPHLAKSGCRV
jgi:hypothetical protein